MTYAYLPGPGQVDAQYQVSADSKGDRIRNNGSNKAQSYSEKEAINVSEGCGHNWGWCHWLFHSLSLGQERSPIADSRKGLYWC